MPKQEYLIRKMTRQEVDLAVQWAAKEGWNPGIHDADCFYKTDPNGFFIGLLDNKPISCISAVAYDNSFGFIGLYIVKSEYRGKGYGIQIWNKAIEYLKTQNIGLDGVLAAQKSYKKSGFKLYYRNIRYQGKSLKNNYQYPDIVKLSLIPFQQIKAYDNNLFPAPRPQFLKCWLKQPESYAFGALKNNQLVGYSVIRRCQQGYKIGPLFADDKNIAEKLFNTMNACLTKGTEIFLDIPEINPAAVALAKNHHLTIVFETARMYTKKQPKINLNKVFGVTTFELG